MGAKFLDSGIDPTVQVAFIVQYCSVKTGILRMIIAIDPKWKGVLDLDAKKCFEAAERLIGDVTNTADLIMYRYKWRFHYYYLKRLQLIGKTRKVLNPFKESMSKLCKGTCGINEEIDYVYDGTGVAFRGSVEEEFGRFTYYWLSCLGK